MNARPAICWLAGALLLAALPAPGLELKLGDRSYTGERLPGTEVIRFAGIRYAAPPMGPLRWQAPQPPAPDASLQTPHGAFPPVCMQGDGNVEWYRRVARGFGRAPEVIDDTPAASEDCLFLNVWTPAPRADARLPVMVWVHGGSNLNGWSYEPNYRGSALAAQGIVVVSVQYRLGVFGFLAHPQLIDESPQASAGNYGILDQIRALQWVRDHIAAFGGDPDNVTAFGESAGAGDIGYLLVSPLANGLFHRAVSQSGGWPVDRELTLAEQAAVGERFVAAAGFDGIDALRRLDARRLLELASEKFQRDYDDPAVDGWLLPRAPARLLADGRFEPRPLIIGSNRHEILMYVDDTATEQDWQTRLDRLSDDPQTRRRIGAALAHLPLHQRLDTLDTATGFLCPSLRFAAAFSRRAPVWVYRFDRVRNGGAKLGAYHGAEIPYVFDTHDAWLPTDDADRA